MDETVFSLLDSPALSNSGSVAFYGQVDGGARRGIWAGLPNNLAVAAQSGGIAPDTGGAAFDNFRLPILSAGGTLGFWALLQSASTGVTQADNTGIWVGLPSALELVVREGTMSSEMDFVFDEVYASQYWALNDHGQIVFEAEDARALPSRRGLWLGDAERIDLLALEGALAPGTDFHFGFLGIGALNSAGDVSFAGTLRDASSLEKTGNWMGPAENIQLLARSGQMAPGAEPMIFINVPAPDLNGDGVAVFASQLLFRDDVHSGIWTGRPDSLALVVRDGMEAPGTGGAKFGSLISPPFLTEHPLINAQGVLAFYGTLDVESGGATPDDDLGLWRGSPDALELVTRKGNTAPGTHGATFLAFHELALNARGDVAFTGDLVLDTGTVSEENNEGLWVRVGDVTSLVVREGQLVDVDPTEDVDLRQVLAIGFSGGSGGEDGRRMALGDRRTILFQLDFTDGSRGIFTARVPEPASILLVEAGGIALLIAPMRRALTLHRRRPTKDPRKKIT